MIEEIEIPWPVEVLRDLGFQPRDAVRLSAVLPPVEVGVVAPLHQHVLETTPEMRYWYWHEPAAHVLWALTNITIHQAISLTRAGRGLIDVIVIYDAVEAHVHRRMSIEGFDIVHAWAMERLVPRHRLARYIGLGFPPAKAAALEADPGGPPSEDALDMLAALRRSPL